MRKPADKVTGDDAAEVQRMEVSWRRPLLAPLSLATIYQRCAAQARALGGPPGRGSTSANIQSIADRNAGQA